MSYNSDKTKELNLEAGMETYGMMNFLRDVGRSLAGNEMDFTSGTIRKAIFLLSVPMVLEMIMESIFALVDIYFVDKIGPGAVATVGITESIMTVVYALSFGLSSAATAIVSRRIGEKNQAEASKAAFQAILTGLVVSLPLSVVGILYADSLLTLMGAEPAIVEQYSSYTRIMFGTNLVIVWLFIINSVIRSSGDAAISMRVLTLANVLNIILCPCLIFGWGPFPAMGIAGAATATTIGRGIGVLYQFYILFSGKHRVKLTLGSMKPDFRLIFRIVKLSLGSTAQNLISTSSWIFLVRILSTFGSEVVAGYTIGIRLIFFVMMPSAGLSNAAATLVGQNLGAGQPERAEKSVWITSRYNMAFLGSIGIFFVLFPEFWVALLSKDPGVLKYGSESLRAISFGFLSYALGMVMINSFNGAGDTKTPMIVCTIAFWLIEVPLAYLLAIVAGLGEVGVYYSIVFAETCFALIALHLFRKGRWKQKMV